MEHERTLMRDRVDDRKREVMCRNSSELLEREVHWRREGPHTERRNTVFCRDMERVRETETIQRDVV